MLLGISSFFQYTDEMIIIVMSSMEAFSDHLADSYTNDTEYVIQYENIGKTLTLGFRWDGIRVNYHDRSSL